MAQHTCECGARYKFPDSAIGKRAKCQKCGAVFTLREKQDTGMIAIADDPAIDRPESIRPSIPPSPRQGAIVAPEHSPAAMRASVGGDDAEDATGDARGDAGLARPSRTLAFDVVWTFLFAASLGNLFTFLGLWFIVFCVSFLVTFSFWGFLCAVILAGWFAAFRFEVVRSAAAGDEDLPELPFSTDFMADFAYPAFSWLGSWFAVLCPAVIFLVVASTFNMVAPDVAGELIGGGLRTMLKPGPGVPAAFTALAYVGVFFWPMVILCVALGGFSTLYRVDLMVQSILRTIGGYSLLVLLILGVLLLDEMLDIGSIGWSSPATRRGGLWALLSGGGIATWILSLGIGIYLEIVAMRLIGLYYHHFKRKFAWSWG